MPEFPERFVAGRKRAQIAGVLLSALGIFLLLSLVTHSKFDPPNASRFGEMATINWAGRIGAYVSHGAFTAVGYGALLLPVLCLQWAWNRLRRQPLRADLLRSVGLLGVGLFFTAGSGLPTYSHYTAFEL
ncbi:uncharacterized protein METZ01_LOCUS447768, partial [marine metagenome]